MASSDDEEENVPNVVTGYYFVDESNSPISFAVLPIQFNDCEGPEAPDLQVFLHGSADGGLRKIYKQVIAWKLGFQGHQPELLVLSKDNIWIKLQKARKSYEENIRTTLVTIHVLHYLRENPETSEKSLWDHIRKTFRSFDVRHSEDDLSDHFPLIKQFTERDEILGKAEILPLILAGLSRKRTNSVEAVKKDLDMKSFIVEDVDFDDSDDSDIEPDLFDSVCAICDNGGDLLCCEGECLRSFHATRSAAAESNSKCKSLGFTEAYVDAIPIFVCKNCEYKQHQCFACGKLGPSGKSANAEVFQCVNATCGHFYHPKCVAELLFPEHNVKALEYEKRIASGESFTCPVHKCIVCKQAENKEVPELQFAMCRRCPKSYHRKCLPRKIAFEDNKEEGIVQRAWDDDLLPNRILIFCLKHKIDKHLKTPIRNHIIFPQMYEEKKGIDVQKTNTKIFETKIKEASGGVPKEKGSGKPKKVAEKHSSAEEKLPAERRGGSISERLIDLQKNVKPLKYGSPSDPHKRSQPSLSEYKKFSNDQAKTSLAAISSAPIESEFCSSFPSIDEEIEKRVLTLMEKASVSITLKSITEKRVMPSTHAHSARHADNNIHHGKVEGFVEAIKTALQKVECGHSVYDAKAVCEPEILKQISKWNNKLKVYLAPFLHGMRYTSFGRHFTKVDKLKEIVDVLQWYVQSGDMIVDFCCGANDFSQLMKEKLEAAGKKCSFKNFDVIQPKNDFCFEKRDWMKVQLKDLPTGSQLIMGLNPPFGVKAALANKFIDKALTFKPKILILIVPSETERLDEKRSKYDLIWENCEKLAGKSFYLPGSVNENDKQIEQWNLKPPVLYLWSRPDWTAKHKAIAARHNHRSTEQHVSPAAETQNELLADAKRLNEEINDAMEEEVKVPELISSKRKPAEEDQFSRESSKNAEHSNKKTAQKMNEFRGDDSTNVDCGNKRKSPGNQKSGPSKRRESYRRTESFDRSVADDMTSDMSISPPFEAIARNPLDLHQTSAEAEPLFEAVTRHHLDDVHQASGAAETPFDCNAPYNSFSEHRLEFGAASGSVRSTNSFNEESEGIAKRYAFDNGSSHRASSELGNLDCHIPSSEDRPGGYSRDSCIDTYGRRSHTSDLDGCRQSSGSDIHSQFGLYNQQGIYDSAPRNRYPLDGSDSSLRQYLPSMGGPEPILGQYSTMIGAPNLVRSQYSLPNCAMPNPVRETSAMQRYAPHLDETNYVPPSSYPREPFPGRNGHFDMPGEPFPGRNGHFDMPGEPFPGRNGHFDMPGEPFPGRNGHFDMPGMRRDLPPNLMGFAPGPHQFVPHPGSAGWLDD